MYYSKKFIRQQFESVNYYLVDIQMCKCKLTKQKEYYFISTYICIHTLLLFLTKSFIHTFDIEATIYWGLISYFMHDILYILRVIWIDNNWNYV